MVFTVDGKRHELDLQELTGRDVKAFRAATGEPFRKAITLFIDSPADVDIDTVAGIVWLAKRQAGEVVEFDAVLDAVTYQTEFSVDPAAEAVDLPQL